MALIARSLGPEGYAWYALAGTMAAFTAAVLLQPVHQALGRFLSRDASLAAALARLIIQLAAQLTGIALIAEIAFHFRWPALAGLALAALVLGLAQNAFDFSAQHASARLQPARYALIYVLKAALLLVAALLLWRVGLGAAYAVALVGMASLLAILIAGRQGWIGLMSARLDTGMRQRVKTFCLPLGMSILVSNALLFADRFVLAAAAPAQDLGAYAAVGDLAQQSLGFLFGSLYLAWYPRMVVAHEHAAGESQRLASRYAMLAMAVLLPATLGFGLLGGPLTNVFFGAAYADTSAQVWWPISLTVALAGIRMYFLDIGLYLTSRMGLQLRNVSIAAILVILLDLWWIPIHGAAGAAWAAVAGQCFALVMSAMTSRGILRWHMPWRQAWPALPACGLMAVVILNLDGQDLTALVVKIVLGGLVYGLVMLALDGAGCRNWLRSVWRAGRGR